ncbi:hypothetical protein B0O80DRAFT_499632 [Mortierella sp. GBAus27b]|nr:hypothetical protein BGX31_003211 [Mortierella sp. GBA43]KAI8352334.1 hypothetical protein B0O80DRAFT_499632 [Mortierella sp. GBAus27b]
MFGLFELDELICRQLSRQDLTQCARVNREWHSITIPILWRDLQWVQYRTGSWHLFRNMILEDYRQLQEEEFGIQSSTHATSSHPLPALTKYGTFVRHLPSPDWILRTNGQGTNDTPEALELLRHLFSRCPAMDFKSLFLDSFYLDSDDCLRIMTQYALPCVRALSIQTSVGHPLEARRFRHLLSHCSSKLEQLTLHVHVYHSGGDGNECQDHDKPKHWERLKKLVLLQCDDTSESKGVWSWLWRGCGQVESLEVKQVEDILQSLRDGMLNHMPNLDTVWLGRVLVSNRLMTDNTIATILSGGRKGWRDVRVRPGERFEKASMKALASHFSTLEMVVITHCSSVSGEFLVQVLSSCPNLHTMMDVQGTLQGSKYHRLDANLFIDRDPVTGLLRPWPCETTLKEFWIKITGIPRLDSENDGNSAQAMVQRSHKIQHQVYERLARFVHLETLGLGEYHEGHGMDQPDCLELSLQSGLHKLSGLKSIKCLNIFGLKTRIRISEVQWMIEQWPKLHSIQGLDKYGVDEETAKWLRENHPEIDLDDIA